jgi:hypothetical protein
MAGTDGLLHCVVDFEDDALGAVVAVEFFFVFAADDGEGVHDVADGVARGGKAGPEAGEVFGGFVIGATVGLACGHPVTLGIGAEVEVKEGGVEFGAEQANGIGTRQSPPEDHLQPMNMAENRCSAEGPETA